MTNVEMGGIINSNIRFLNEYFALERIQVVAGS